MPTPHVDADQTRSDADPDRVALLLPGGRYTPAHPLLHFARAVLLRAGWTVQELWWWPDVSSWTGLEPAAEFVRARVEQALERERAGRLLLVGKSLGTFAAAIAAEQDIPSIWLTPVLTDPRVAEPLRRARAGTLLIGGTADPVWDSEVARSTGAKVVEIPGADHGLETDDDPINSAVILRRVVVEMGDFVANLAADADVLSAPQLVGDS